MDFNASQELLIKLNIKKLKVLCETMGIKFKSKWKKADYIAEIRKKFGENGGDESNENAINSGINLSLGENVNVASTTTTNVIGNNVLIELEENLQFGNEVEGKLIKFEEIRIECVKCNGLNVGDCLCKRRASTPISKPSKKKRPELLFGSGIHKWFNDLCGKNALQPDQIENWKARPFPSTIPMITSVEVYNYMVQAKSVIDNNSSKHFKGFQKAVAHHEAQDVIGGLETCIVYEQFLYVKSRCYPSMRSESYRVVVVLDSVDRTICGGACECVIGKSGSCSHVGASLLFLEQYAKMDDEEFQVSCTSKPCSWNAPKTRKIVSRPLTEISFNKPKLFSGTSKSSGNFETMIYSKYDPRHPDDRTNSPKRLKDAVLELANILPKTGVMHFWELESSVAFEVEVGNGVHDDRNESHLSQLNQFVYNPGFVYRDIDEKVLQLFVESQIISQEMVDLIESETKEQSSNNFRKSLRRGRITSSIFGQILGCREKKFPTSLVDTILNPSKLDSYSKLPPAILRGRKLESIARMEYEKRFNVTVESSGLSLMPEHAFIGASGDGIITDATMASKGVLEIKCPSSVKGTDITKMKISAIVDNFPSFCLKKENGEIKLDRKSHYYAQVQGEIAVKKLEWADFVVYNEAPEDRIFKERILFDNVFWHTKLLPKILNFFTKYIAPFLVNELDYM